MELANEIIRQLGGAGKLKMFTGAKGFIALNNGVSFRIGNRKTNYVKIVLNSMDTYDVTFALLRSGKMVNLREFNGIYNDGLKELFERETGMYLSFEKGGEINDYKFGYVIKDEDGDIIHESVFMHVGKNEADAKNKAKKYLEENKFDIIDGLEMGLEEDEVSIEIVSSYAEGGGITLDEIISDDSSDWSKIKKENVDWDNFDKLPKKEQDRIMKEIEKDLRKGRHGFAEGGEIKELLKNKISRLEEKISGNDDKYSDYYERYGTSERQDMLEEVDRLKIRLSSSFAEGGEIKNLDYTWRKTPSLVKIKKIKRTPKGGYSALFYYVDEDREKWERLDKGTGYNLWKKDISFADGGDIGGWETNPNGTHYNLKKGGEIIWTDTSLNNYAPYKLWESYKNIHNQQSVGAFAHRDNKKYIGDYYLFMLDDYDRDFYSHLPLKPNEILFRTETETGKISKSNPLIKINVDKGWIYFMSDDNDPNSDEDDKNPKFNTRAVETLYLSLNSKIKSYNQGLIPYEEISSYAKGGSIKSSWFKGGLSFLNW
mgnify:FL=1|tara:strand:- start:4850 stop:6475 length:1626 start_codon:yes stop_codon:yes gene_type:complete